MKMNSKLELLLIPNRNSTLYYRKLLNGRDTSTIGKDYFILGKMYSPFFFFFFFEKQKKYSLIVI